ncbi:MAG: hypothetical protein ACP5P0_05280, partial [Hydrogenobacter sp.]
MEKDPIDIKRLFILMLAITLFAFAFELYTYYFLPKEKPTTQVKKETFQTTLPQLMLGSTRESQKPLNVQSFDLGQYSISVALEGGKLVRIVDKKYSYDLITDTERKLNAYPLEIYTGNPEIDQKLNFSPYTLTKD